MNYCGKLDTHNQCLHYHLSENAQLLSIKCPLSLHSILSEVNSEIYSLHSTDLPTGGGSGRGLSERFHGSRTTTRMLGAVVVGMKCDSSHRMSSPSDELAAFVADLSQRSETEAVASEIQGERSSLLLISG